MRLLAARLAALLLLAVRPAGSAAPVAPPGLDGWKTMRVPMRDGIALAMDVRLPAQPGRYPTILEITPYGRGPDALSFRNEAGYWNAHGYAFAIADVRGTGDSGGRAGYFSPDDAKDGAELIGWIASRGWSDGKVGLRGASYTGTNQWFIAREHPPALKCITPSAVLGQPMEDVPYHDGVFGTGWGIRWIGHDIHAHRLPQITSPHPDSQSWLDHRPLLTLDSFATGRVLPLWRTFLDHPTYDAYWRRRAWSDADFSGIDIPALMFTGWFDGTMWGTIWRYQQARRLAASRRDMWLVVGAYTHGDAPDGGMDFRTGRPVAKIGDLAVPPQAVLPGREMTRAFYDWCLKGGPRPGWPSARVYVTGADRWIEAPAWPVAPTRPTSLYFASDGHANGLAGDGRLVWRPRAAGAPFDRYRHDPMHPIPDAVGGETMFLPVDPTPLLGRKDLLVYTSAPLSKPLTVVGDVTVELVAATSARDADFVVQLIDVAPDGHAIKLGSKAAAAVRARYRKGLERQVQAVPGQPMRLTVKLRAIGHQFAPGHRIRLWVGSSFYPFLGVNPGTGRPLATDTATPVAATQTLFHSPARPSRIVLPVVEKPRFAD